MAVVTAGDNDCILYTHVFSEERGQSMESHYVYDFALHTRNKEVGSYASRLLSATLHGDIVFFLINMVLRNVQWCKGQDLKFQYCITF